MYSVKSAVKKGERECPELNKEQVSGSLPDLK